MHAVMHQICIASDGVSSVDFDVLISESINVIRINSERKIAQAVECVWLGLFPPILVPY